MDRIKGYFKIITLKKLNEKDLTGYDLIKSIKKIFDKKPSAGSIYPLLNDFLKKGYVTVRQESRKKIYSITNEGKKTLAKITKEKQQLMIKSAELLKVFGNITDRKELESFNKLISQIKSKSETILKNIRTTDTKKSAIKSFPKKNNEKKQEQVKNILQKTIDELIKLEKSA